MFDFRDVKHMKPWRLYFWSPENWSKLNDESLSISGKMKGAPRLEIIAVLKAQFPGIAFSCLSTTEHEWIEHWGFEESDELHLI